METAHRPTSGARALWIGLGILVAQLGDPASSRGNDPPSCARPCKVETAACRREQCAGLQGESRRSCIERCRGLGGCAAIRTMAYVVTECREDASGTAGRQTLVIRRGNCEPVVAFELPRAGPVHDPVRDLLGDGLCTLFGRFRAGYRSVLAGAFQRIGVSPDGSVVVFEITNDFKILPDAFPLPTGFEEGIYVVGADGNGLERLGAPSRNQSGRLVVPREGRGLPIPSTFDVGYRFSPDGRRIVFTDKGPGPAGEDAIQIVTLDLDSRERRQITHLSAAADVSPSVPVTFGPRFVNARTVVFFTYADLDGRHPDGAYYKVRTDTEDIEAVSIEVTEGAQVGANFDVGGGGSSLVSIALPGSPVDIPNGKSFTEMFVIDGKHLLQVTNFRRTDTGYGGKVIDRRRRRGYFTASPNHRNQNPSENCQLFSVDTLGTRLRQLTKFREAELSLNGCTHSSPPGCGIGPVFQDPTTATLVFYSSCDAFGTGFYGGQLYAMRPDGTGLRQLTATRGMITESDGSVSVELPGPVAYSAIDGGR